MNIERMVLADYGVEPTVDGARRHQWACRAPSRQRVLRRRFAAWFEPGAMPPVFDAFDGKVDPMAFWYAARILERVRGPRTDRDHGGWDSEGHWGLSGRQVRQCWYAAGCRPSRKFEVLLLLGGNSDRAAVLRRRPCKRLSIRQINDAARALRRTSAFVIHPLLSTKLLCALGRLCPELQRVAIGTLPDAMPRRQWRIADVDWAKVSEVQEQFQTDQVLRVAWATGRRQRDLCGLDRDEVSGYLGHPEMRSREASEFVRSDPYRAFVGLVNEAEAGHE